MTDTRIAFGAFCTWWGPVTEAASARETGRGVPTCPHCGGVLYEEPTLDAWYRRLDFVPADMFPDYRKVMDWQRDNKTGCFPSYGKLRAAYDEAFAVRHPGGVDGSGNGP